MKPKTTKIKKIAAEIHDLANEMRVAAHMAREPEAGEALCEAEAIAEAIQRLASIVFLRQNWKRRA